jgi:iron-sulfur cluster assembly accessory protein
MITVTESAVKQLQILLDERRAETADAATRDALGLRIFVEKGGCSGLEYGMRFEPGQPGDEAVECPGGARVLVDSASASYLRDCTIDYHDGLTGAGFRIVNPNAVRTCGCGSSFEPAAAAAGAP